MADLISMMSAAAGLGGGEYEISRSLRFNSADSAYLDRTPASAGNRKTWTWSGWVKRSALGSFQNFMRAGTTLIRFTNTETIQFESNSTNVVTNAVFRDVSAWYHVVFSIDTTQATSSNRTKIYVNGVLQSLSGSYVNQNVDTDVNNTTQHNIGASVVPSEFLNGYLTEINFIDGQALTPTDFGEFNTDTGVWQPIEYTGTYGTNGFYLPFSDNASTTTLGDDFSGNGNDWTTNNFSVTAGAGNDSLVDSPTRYGTDTGAGGEVRGNYCTLNPLDTGPSMQSSVANGNLELNANTASSGNGTSNGTIAVNSGKWYFEAELSGYSGSGALRAGWNYVTNGVGANAGITGAYKEVSSNQTVIIAVDLNNFLAWVGSNGSWDAGDPSSGTGGTSIDLLGYLAVPFVRDNSGTSGNGGKWTANFGQRPFVYTAPSGFKALVTTNLPEPTIADGGEYFNTVLYTGNSSTQSITSVGFQPDFVWSKCRNVARSHRLSDAVRGSTKDLYSDTTAAEGSDGSITAFTSTGFNLNNATGSAYNTSGENYVSWAWKANGAGVSNTDGTITSTVSANTDSGFSIVTYTGTGSAATVGHGLGAVPRMIIVKNRDAADAWQVYHAANTANPETDYLVLNTTAATADAADRWNDTLPTSTVFSIGNGVEVNTNTEDYVAYVFAQIAGYSAFGSYTGNGSADGSFVYLGFRPRYAIFKSTTTTTGWFIWDSVTNTFNVMTKYLAANVSDAEGTYTGVDFLSNGFKFRSSSAGDGFNQSGETYIYMAFSEVAFNYSLGR
jgi:hypothetical protein